jgi:hypothetical protein
MDVLSFRTFVPSDTGREFHGGIFSNFMDKDVLKYWIFFGARVFND